MPETPSDPPNGGGSTSNPLECASPESMDRFMQLLTGEQPSLFRYITALTGDPNEASNVLQETNLVIWRKASEFNLGGNFGAWSRSIALWQVKAWLRDRGRDRHVFSSDLVQQLSERPAAWADVEPRRQALRKCVKVLKEDERELLRQRYAENFSILEIAKIFHKTPFAVKSGLFRIRKTLRSCVERRVAESL